MFLTSPNATVSDRTWSPHEELACRVLRGDPEAGNFPLDAELQSTFLQYADRHGLQALLCAQLRSSDCGGGWPSDLREALAAEAASQAALEILQGQEAVRVLEALTQRGIRPLLMKGAPLAYTHYCSPHHRPRGDTDVLIRRVDREAAGSVLSGMGYARRNLTSGELVSYQYTWSRLDRHGMTHVIDLHWRVSNSQMFADALSYDEIAHSSVALPQLGGRALGPVHALLLACMHRVVHITAPYFLDDSIHYGDRLIWLYDIHLLVSQMRPQELTQFAQLALERRLSTICVDGLRQSQRCFATPLPEEIIKVLSNAGAPEPSAQYLDPGRLRHLVTDIRSLSNWRDRLRLAREHLFPPAEYILKKYAVSHRAWLPVLYLRRGMQGIWRLIRE